MNDTAAVNVTRAGTDATPMDEAATASDATTVDNGRPAHAATVSDTGAAGKGRVVGESRTLGEGPTIGEGRTVGGWAGALDARLLLPAAGGWLAAVLLVAQSPRAGYTAALTAAGLAVALLVLARRWKGAWAAAGLLVVISGLSVAAAFQVQRLNAGPVRQLASGSDTAKVRLRIDSDPLVRTGTSTRRPPYVVVRATVEQVRAHGTTTSVRTPVLVVASAAWRTVRLGQRVETVGRFEQTERGSDIAAMISARGKPRVVAEPGWWLRAAEHVRAGLRQSVAPEPPPVRGLVPALVMGDESALPAGLVEDFETTGLTHLSAVSGTNLTLLLAFVLPMARLAGIRARWLTVFGVATVVVFIVLARPQPSVLRAAVMGLVALAAITGHGSGRRAVRSLSIAVIVLLFIDTALARSAGFALSVLATAGIVLLAPGWRDSLARWLPDRLADAIACPLAAQVACTPVVAWLSGEVSLVAVAANLLAGPAVGPATILGFGAAAMAVISDDLARLGGWAAGWPARWIILVAETGADLPGASGAWPATVLGVTVLTGLCLALTLGLHRLLARPFAMVLAVLLLIIIVVRPIRSLGWPPPDWLLVGCDVGQGDGLVLRTGPASAVVVDTGPDPAPIDRCLRDLGITEVPVIVLTHFHADHTGGLAGVLHNRQVSEIQVTPYFSPPAEHRRVTQLAHHHRVPIRPVTYRETRTVGPLTWTTLWPAQVPALPPTHQPPPPTPQAAGSPPSTGTPHPPPATPASANAAPCPRTAAPKPTPAQGNAPAAHTTPEEDHLLTAPSPLATPSPLAPPNPLATPGPLAGTASSQHPPVARSTAPSQRTRPPTITPPSWRAASSGDIRPGHGTPPSRGALTSADGQPAADETRPASGLPSGEGSPENNASVTMMVESGGLRILLTGDLEPEAQRAVLATGADLRADVLKVPHHGSVRQEPAFLAATQARLALISAGRDNDYGHPAPRTLTLLTRQGTHPTRTDTSGPIAISNPANHLTYTTPKSAVSTTQ